MKSLERKTLTVMLIIFVSSNCLGREVISNLLTYSSRPIFSLSQHYSVQSSNHIGSEPGHEGLHLKCQHSFSNQSDEAYTSSLWHNCNAPVPKCSKSAKPYFCSPKFSSLFLSISQEATVANKQVELMDISFSSCELPFATVYLSQITPV